jgi:ATP-dependent DNA ligase
MASRPPSGANWVHEIKHDGYRMIVRRDVPIVRLYSRNANDWTVRLPAIAAAAERIRARSFTLDGEAVVMGPDGLSRFEKLRRREAAHNAILYAFDPIAQDGEDVRDRARSLSLCRRPKTCTDPDMRVQLRQWRGGPRDRQVLRRGGGSQCRR